jgi:O-antigen ligase
MLVTAFTLPLENQLDLPGLGRMSKLAGMLCALVWAISVLSTGRLRRPRAVHILALLYVLWTACSLMWTVDGPATEERVFTYVQLLGLMLVVWDTVTTLDRVRQSLIATLAGCYVALVSVLVKFFTLGSASQVHGRVTVGDFHPNDLGLILALGVPIAAYLVEVPGEDRWRLLRRLLAAAYLPLSGFAILLTGSRAGLAALIPGFVYLGYLLTRRHPALAVGALVSLAAVAVLIVPFASPQVAARIAGTETSVQSGDLNERGAIWAEAIRLFEAHPIVGVGSGAFPTAAVGVNKVGHNLVLALLAEVGIIGFGLFAAMGIAALVWLRRSPPVLRGMWAAIFVAWSFAAMLHNWEYRKQTWFFIGLMVACGALGYAEDDDKKSGRHRDEGAARELQQSP